MTGEEGFLEGREHIPSGCAICGLIDRTGRRFSGDAAIRSISVMHDRSNGLGGGFAGYGIYPEYKDFYAFHLFFYSTDAKKQTEAYLDEYYDVINLSKIPVTRTKAITDEPLIWRYFVAPSPTKLAESQLDEQEFVVRSAIHINSTIKGAYLFSSGKNMGVFKAVGYPEDVGRFYRLDEYEGYCWTAHGRYPTNTTGWWGGSHPFALLDTTVVHNGEISSYDANRRAIEMFGYRCTLSTDTEVITYMLDYLHRRKGLSFRETAQILAAPFWFEIEHMHDREKQLATYLRTTYSSFLVTGPFSILIGFTGGLMALNDRLKLRSLVSGSKGSMTYFASEEAAIRAVEPEVENLFAPRGGEPVVVHVEGM